MCDPGTLALTSAIVGAGTAVHQTNAQRKAANYQAAVAENNAQVAKWQATDALRRGRTDESLSRLETGQQLSAQMAQLAANGVDLNSASSLRQLTDTEFFGELDALTLRDNARNEAYGYETQQASLLAQANGSRAAARNQRGGLAGTTSLLGSASRYYGGQYARR